MLRYAITSRVLLANTEPERARMLTALAAGWSADGVDFIQIRESDLAPADLARLAVELVRAVRKNGAHTKVLINASRETAVSVALESGADGIHLSGGLDADQLATAIAQVREAWPISKNTAARPPMSVSCHSTGEVQAARAAGAALALFAPVFEKLLPGAHALAGQGLESLAEACRAARWPSPYPELPVFALGGVTLENAPQCLAAGAAGIAAIRLFLDGCYEVQASC
jgi:thiamine-phosphate pyrophosphorylase